MFDEREEKAFRVSCAQEGVIQSCDAAQTDRCVTANIARAICNCTLLKRSRDTRCQTLTGLRSAHETFRLCFTQSTQESYYKILNLKCLVLLNVDFTHILKDTVPLVFNIIKIYILLWVITSC